MMIFSLIGFAGWCTGCSSSCKAGTLLLHVGLVDDSPLADTITVVGHDPGAAVADSFPHPPNPDAASLGIEHTTVLVTWPQGYPTDADVHLLVSAVVAGQTIGVGYADVDLGSKCGESSLLVSARGGIPDAGD